MFNEGFQSLNNNTTSHEYLGRYKYSGGISYPTTGPIEEISLLNGEIVINLKGNPNSFGVNDECIGDDVREIISNARKLATSKVVEETVIKVLDNCKVKESIEIDDEMIFDWILRTITYGSIPVTNFWNWCSSRRMEEKLATELRDVLKAL